MDELGWARPEDGLGGRTATGRMGRRCDRAEWPSGKFRAALFYLARADWRRPRTAFTLRRRLDRRTRSTLWLSTILPRTPYRLQVTVPPAHPAHPPSGQVGRSCMGNFGDPRPPTGPRPHHGTGARLRCSVSLPRGTVVLGSRNLRGRVRTRTRLTRPLQCIVYSVLDLLAPSSLEVSTASDAAPPEITRATGATELGERTPQKKRSFMARPSGDSMTPRVGLWRRRRAGGGLHGRFDTTSPRNGPMLGNHTGLGSLSEQ